MSHTPLASLKVTSTTTLDQLKTFQESIGKDDAKLRGKVNDDGSITLKAVDRDSSFLSRITGLSKKRRDAARSALTMVMTNSGAADRKPTANLNSLVNTSRGHSPRSAALKDLLTLAQSTRDTPSPKFSEKSVNVEKHDDALLKRDFPRLETKGLSLTTLASYSKLARDLAGNAPLGDDKVTQFANEIRLDLMAQLTRNGPLGLNERSMLGVSDIGGFITEAMSTAVPRPHTEHVSATLDKIANLAAQQMSHELLGTRLIDDNSFQLGKDVFTRVGLAGSGGYGKADVYQCEATGKLVVLKKPGSMSNLTDAAQREAAKFGFRAEIDMHTKVMEQDGRPHPEMKYPHVVEFEGAVRLPDGLFATVTEACTAGKMSDVFKALDAALGKKVLTQDQLMAAKLTLLRDMVDGQSVINKRGFSHRDVKFENVFVTSAGAGKVADFGETAFSKTFSLSNEKIVLAVVFLAPENLVARSKIEGFERNCVNAQFAVHKAKVDVFNRLVGPGGILEDLGLRGLDASNFDEMDDDTTAWDVTRKEQASERRAAQIEKAIAEVPEFAEAIKSITADSTSAEVRRLLSDVAAQKTMLPTETLIDGEAADVWALGTSILYAAIGPNKTINAGQFSTKDEANLVKYFNEKPKDAQSPLPEPLTKGSFLSEGFKDEDYKNGTVTGDIELDKLVNMTLQRDPKARPSFADILALPIFTRDGVGETATRNLIAALGSKEPLPDDAIKALAAKMAV